VSDRQIVCILDRLHGGEPCRWSYNGFADIYTCECDQTFTGREVIPEVEQMNYYPLRVE
jgi:hypothetical protein